MKFSKLFLITSLFLAVISCDEKKKIGPSTQSVVPKPKYLYVSTGTCYSATNTTFTSATSSNLVYRISLASGQKDLTLADYFASPANPGDTPVALVDFGDSVYISVENTAGRRIEKVAKAQMSSRQIFSSNSTVLSSALRGLVKTPDNGLLISKSNSIEKVTSQGVRMGTPYIPTALGASCGATNANIVSMATSNSGKIFYVNAAASNNRLGIISPNGYSTSADCLRAQTSPDTNAYPTSIVFLKDYNQIIVAYAGNAITNNLNSIYAYDFDEASNTIGLGVKLYDASNYTAAGYLLYGISAMAYNSDDNSLYVATAISNATTVVNYAIEKLRYDPVAKSISRIGSTPFYNYGVDTKCVSSMMIAE